ncbi:MAG: glycosyltransferase family 39 protein [Planctomycetes bacterium]|nr:glycosyltransferase family 39 protein [Planctomycetota bacterium]
MADERVEHTLFWACTLVGALLCVAMPVFAQESYYWCYAEHPDLSYFDHPPMVAWQIWVGTALFGDNAIGIRFGTWLCATGTTWIGLLWLRRLGAESWVRRCWLACTFAMPMLLLAHFMSTPDPPLVFWWAATMYALHRARDGHTGWWLAAGLAAGCALLSKYTAAFLAIGGVLTLAFDPQMRRQLRRPGPYLSQLVAAVTFLPVVVWNVANDFESFRFQTERRWEHAEFGGFFLGRFLLHQTGLLHPWIALSLPFALWWLARRAARRDLTALWMVAFAAPLPLFFLCASMFIKVKMNWLMPCALPLAAVVLTWLRSLGTGDQPSRAPRLTARVLVVSAMVLAIVPPIIHLVPQPAGTSWQGWDRIAERAEYWEEQLDARDGVPDNVFFFASGYRDAAQLSLHLKRRTRRMSGDHHLEAVLAQNVFGVSALQFDHWEPADKHIGQNAIFVLLRPDRRHGEIDKLNRHFASATRVERVEIRVFGRRVAVADIYEARGYRGPKV